MSWLRMVTKGLQIFGKTFTQSWSDGIKETAKKAASGSDKIGNISVKESKQILGIDDVNEETIQKKYDYLYKANAKESGGSIYLQAKVTNAKIRLEEAIKNKEPLD